MKHRRFFGRILSVFVAALVILPQFSMMVSALDRITFTYADESISVEVDVNAGTVFTDENGTEYPQEEVRLYAYPLAEDDPRFSTLETESGTLTKFFDIGFESGDGAYLKAEGADAAVRYTMPETTAVKNISDLQVYQYIGDAENDILLEEASNVHTVRSDNAVAFSTDALSSYAVVYTVDYDFNGRTMKMAGGSSLLLSALFDCLEIDLPVAEVADVRFSDDTLMRITKVSGEVSENDQSFDAGEGDWLLTSLGVFHTKEKLTVTLNDGTDFTIKVTDAEYSTDLSRFLTEMKLIIDGNVITADNDGETIEVVDGELYNLILSFEETPELQFSDTQALTFRLPDAFHPPRGFSMSLDINLGRYGKLMNNPVSYDPATNTLTMMWNQEDATHYQRLIASSNAKFTLNVRGTIDADVNRFMFDSEKGVWIERHDPHNAMVQKFGTYDPDTQSIVYSIEVTSDGTCENISLDDYMGSALIYQNDIAYDAAASINTAETLPVITNTGGTFHVDIPAMNNGDSLIFTYSCLIDLEGIGVSGNATFDETGNTAVIAGDSNPNDNISEYAQNEIFFADMQKENRGVGGTYTIGDTPYRDISWRIDTNHQPLISFAGSQITDTIDPRVQAMCSYSGDGITVKCYDMNGTLQATRVLSWADLGYNPMTDDIKSWVYNVPDDDPPYEYIIDYKTKVDMSQITVQTVINNIASSKGGEDKAFCIVNPPGIHGLSIHKTHTDFTSDHITWVISVHIDSEYNGDHLTLTEHCNSDNNGSYKYAGLPANSIDGKLYKEFLEKVEIQGLNDDETYVVKYNNRNYSADSDQIVDDDFYQNTSNNNSNGRNTLVIDFYKDQNKAQKGLNYDANGDGGRDIIIRLTTSFDPSWPQAAKRYNTAHNNNSLWMYDHHNWADINGALAVDIATERPVILYKTSVSTQNTRDNSGNYTDTYKGYNVVDPETGLIYEAFRFRVLVQGVDNDDPLVIDDYFDTDLFDLFIPSETDLIQSNGMLMSQRDWEGNQRATRDPTYYDTLFGATVNRGNNLNSTTVDTNSTYLRNVTDGSYTQELTDFGARFTLNEIPKMANGDYYPYYGVEYWLIPKSEEAIAAIEQQIHDGIGTFGTTARGDYKKYDNRAECRGEEASSQYDLYLDNKLLPLLKNSDIDVENNIAHYTIAINKGKLEMNEGLPIVVEDTYSDTLSIDFRSIEIQTDPAYNKDLVSYDFSGHVGTFRVPDSTYVIITYDATILKRPAEDTQIYNTVTALGYEDGTVDTISTDHDASGDAETPGLYLYKFGAGHMEKGLNGARFQLYEYDENGENPTPMVYPEGTAKAGQPIIFETADLDGRPGFIDVTLSQNEDGMTLQTHKKYGLQEITPPQTLAPNGEIINYKPIGFKYTFTMVDSGENPDYTQYEYMIGDTLTVRNSPEAIGIQIHKAISGSTADELTAADKSHLKFTILRKNADGDYAPIMHEVTVNNETYSEINPHFVDIPYDDFVNGSFTLSGLSLEEGSEVGEYMIIETGNSDILAAHPSWEYATTFVWDDGTVTDRYVTANGDPCSYVTISEDDINAGIDKEVYIGNEYTKQAVTLTAEKKWKNVSGSAMAWPGTTPVTLDLYTLTGGVLSASPVRTVVLDGVVDSDGEERSGAAVFRDVPKLDENGDPITYVVKERSGIPGYDTAYTAGSGYAPFTNGTATVTNTQRAVSVSVTKRWQNSENDFTPPAGASVTLELYAYPQGSDESAAAKVNTVSAVMLDGSESPAWTADFRNLPEVNTAGETLVYVVKETACTPAGYEAAYVTGSYAHDGEEILNHPALTEFSVTKEWSGTVDNDWPDDVEAIYLTLQRRGKTSGTVDPTFETICTLTETGVTAAGTAPNNWAGDAPQFSFDNSGNKYTLYATGLDKYSATDEWVYFVTESLDSDDAAVYTPSYFDKNRSDMEGYTTAGGYIRNTRFVRELAVSKTVAGNMGNRLKDFTFTVNLANGDGTPYNGSVDCTVTDNLGNTMAQTAAFVAGSYTFTLKHGETVSFTGLSANMTYTVTEADYITDGYHTTVSQNGGTAQEARTAAGDMADNQSVAFTNTKRVLISTGVSSLLGVAFAVFAAGAGYCIKIMIKRKRRVL